MSRPKGISDLVPEDVEGAAYWQPEEILALAVVQQAVWDVEKAREKRVTKHGGNVYPTETDVDDARDFLKTRFWHRGNLWGEMLKERLCLGEAKEGMARRLLEPVA